MGLLALITGLFTFSLADAAKRSCKDDLIAELAKRSYRRVAEHEIKVGTPGRSLDPEQVLLLGPRPEKTALGQGPLVATDLGWAYFDSNADLLEWEHLAKFVTNGADARRELLRIINDDAYCTPGLDQSTCERLREAYDTIKKMIEDRKDTLTPRAAHTWEEFTEADIIYPWRPHGRKFIPYMTPGNALKTMILFVREATVRHLIFQDGRSAWRTGRDLDLDTRLAVALRPVLAALAPLLVQYPETYTHANLFIDVGAVGIVDQEFRMGTWDMHFAAGLDLNNEKIEEVTAFFSGPPIACPSSERLAELRSALASILETAALKFSEMLPAKNKVETDLDFLELPAKMGLPRDFPMINVHVRGLARAQRVLFFHFLAGELSRLR